MKNIKPIEYKNITVATTQIIAEFLGADINNINVNYHNNKSKFIEGKHYFSINHINAKNLLSDYQGKQGVKLWTERGCARHSKLLNTPESWDLWEDMEDCYFTKSSILNLMQEANRLMDEYKEKAGERGYMGNLLKKQKPLTIKAVATANKLSQLELDLNGGKK